MPLKPSPFPRIVPNPIEWKKVEDMTAKKVEDITDLRKIEDKTVLEIKVEDIIPSQKEDMS